MNTYAELPKRKFSTKHGIGLKWTDRSGTVWRTVNTGRKPIVKLRITSFVGLVGYAEHYYGTLRVYDPACKIVKLGKDDKNHKVGEIFSLGGAYERDKPRQACGISIELKRPLKKHELRTRRFKEYAHFKNPCTNAFYSQRDVIAEAKRVFAKHFAKGWTLEIE